jgi:hypothetical protein
MTKPNQRAAHVLEQDYGVFTVRRIWRERILLNTAAIAITRTGDKAAIFRG